MAATPANPYIVGPPIDNPAQFFGRQDIFDEVERTLRYPTHNAVILYGQRRAGKTSLLLQLERRLPDPPFFTVYYNLSEQTLVKVSEALYGMAAAAAEKAGMPPPDPGDFENNPSAFDQDFLPELYKVLGSERKPVFLLDEFNAVETPESEIDESIAVRSLDTYLFELLSKQSYTDFVFAAGRRMDELSMVLDSTYKADLTRFVPLLNPEQTRALILQEGVAGAVTPSYDEAAIERIKTLARGHPHLTQLLCYHLFERAFQRSAQNPQVTAADVEAVAQQLVETDDQFFSMVWNSMPANERVALAAIAQRIKAEDEYITDADISAALTEAGVSAQELDVEKSTEHLVNWQMLEQIGGYGFFVPLMGRWAARHRTLEQIDTSEISRPASNTEQADQLYAAAQQAYQKGDYKQVIGLLTRALVLVPLHLLSRLLLGKTLREQDQLPEAIEQYEEAYKIDRSAGQTPLVAALLEQGDKAEKRGNIPAALAAYNRVVEIEPDNKTALARLDALKRKTEIDEQIEEKEERRHPWLAYILAGILLLLLCLLCSWFYYPGAGTDSDATTTAVAQVAATRVAATVNAIASVTAEANAAANGGGSGGDQTGGSESGQGTSTSGGAGDNNGSGASGEQDEAGQNAATATAQAAATATAIAIATEEATPQSDLSGEIRVAGSDSMQPVMQELADAFTAQNPDVEITIQPGNANDGLDAVQQGNADVGMIGRELEPSELDELGNSGAQAQNIAENDPIVVIGHTLAPVDNLTTEQIQDIFSGEITNWSEIGGPDAPILVIGREPDSDTRTVFEQILGATGGDTIVEESSNRAVRNAVSTRPFAIGYVPLDQAEAVFDLPPDSQNWGVIDTGLLEIKALAIDQVEPTLENAADGSYPVSRPFNLITKDPPDELTRRWLEFIQSEEGRQIIESAGHAPAP